MRTLFFFYSFLLVNCSVWAETKRFYINRFGIEDGLASNQVNAIYQDKVGFLWIGTPNGLQRFDGRQFINFPIKSPDSQISMSVSDILEDMNGIIWLRVGDEYGTYFPEKQLFTPIPFEEAENRFAGEKLWMDSRGNLFVIITNNILLWIDQSKGLITDKNLPIKIPKGWRPRSIFEDKEGLYWISCVEGIAVFDPDTQVIYTKDFNPLNLALLQFSDFQYVVNIYQDQKGVYWVNYWAPNEKLLSFNPTSKTWQDHKSEIENRNGNYQEAYGVLELPSGQLWRYGLEVLADFDPEQKRFTPLYQSDLKYEKITQALWDHSGGLWLASDYGLYFLHFDTPNIFLREFDGSIGNYEFQAIEEVIYNSDTSIWLGSWGKGLKIFNTEEGELDANWTKVGSPNTIESQQIWAIHQDYKRGWVWIGMQKGLLQVIDLKTKKVIYLNHNIFEGSTIRAITQDRYGKVWFGTHKGALINFHGNQVKEENFYQIRKFQGLIPQLMVSTDQKLWVATLTEGLFLIDIEDGSIIQNLDNSILSSNRIEKLHQLNDSIFLLGSELLNKYNINSKENLIFSYADGMASNGILHIESDRKGLAWINTPNGFTRFDPLTNTFSSFGEKHFFSELISNGRSGTQLADGSLAFISNNSMLVFNPLEFERDLEPPTPVITSVELFGKYLGNGASPVAQQLFKSHQNSLTFYFNLLKFPIQDRFAYYYRLVGADQDWIADQGNFQAVYSLLPPGAYQFEVKCENEIGEISNAAIYPFEIRPNMIQSWWFKAFLILLFLGIVGLIYRMHLNRILAVVKLRNRLARDLHDDMGSTLSTINILSSMAKSKLGTDPVKTSDYISKISENSQRMMESMDDIIWSIKPQNDNMEKLIARMREFATQVLESKDMMFSMKADEEIMRIKLSMDARRDLFLIFKEGINNAAKYSGASNVIVSFQLARPFFIMIIKDDGKGIDLAATGKGNGLSNMKTRASLLNGELKINSEKGKGTELILKLHLKSHQYVIEKRLI